MSEILFIEMGADGRRKMTSAEISATYERLQKFVEGQRTPGNARMKLGADLECEQGLEFLICPLDECDKFFHADFIDALRESFGPEANCYDEPVPGGSVRRFVQVSIMTEETGHVKRFYSPRASIGPSRDKTMVFFFTNVVLLLLLWHRVVTGTHGF